MVLVSWEPSPQEQEDDGGGTGFLLRPTAAVAFSRGLRCFVLSPPFQCAVQLVCGSLITSLFVVVGPVAFPLSCLAPALYSAWVVLLSADNHLGSRLQGGAASASSMAWGAVLGGVVLSVAHRIVPGGPGGAPPVGSGAHTAAVSCLAVAVLPLLAANRAALGPPHPPYLWTCGLTSSLAFGVTLLSGQLITDPWVLWNRVVVSLVLVSFVGSGASGLVAASVMPSLAADEMRADTAAAVRGIGYAATRLASRALRPSATAAAAAAAAAAANSACAPPPTEEALAAGTCVATGTAPLHAAPGAAEVVHAAPRESALHEAAAAGLFPAADPLSAQLPVWGSAVEEVRASEPHLKEHEAASQRPGTATETDRKLVGSGTGAGAGGRAPLPLPSHGDDELGDSDQVVEAGEREGEGEGGGDGGADAADARYAPQGTGGSGKSGGDGAGWGGGDSRYEFHEASPIDEYLEDDDAFLRMLQEASEPPQRRTRRRAHRRASAAAASRASIGAVSAALARLSLPPFLAPPGGIQPSPAAAAASTALGSGPGANAHGGGGMGGGAVAWAPVSALRPLLGRAKACLGPAALEPPRLVSGPTDLARWSRLLSACECLLDRVAALECLVEGEEATVGAGAGGQQQQQQALQGALLAALLGVDVVAPYREAYARVAASCAAVGAALAAAGGGGKGGGSRRRRGGVNRQVWASWPGGWAQLKLRLRREILSAFRGYWARVRGEAAAAAASPAVGRIAILGTSQSRALMFLWSVTEGVLSAVQGLEAAARELLASQQGQVTAPPPADGCAADKVEVEDGGEGHAARDAARPGLEPTGPAPDGAATGVSGGRTGSGIGSSGYGSSGSGSGCREAAARGAVNGDNAAARTGGKRQRASLGKGWSWRRPVPSSFGFGLGWCEPAARGFVHEWDWAWRVLQILLGWGMIRTAAASVASTAALALSRGPAGRRQLLRSRTFQFAANYWLACSTVLLLGLGLAARPGLGLLRRYPPLYGYIATAVAMTERVESTLSRAVLRLAGTVAGGTLGLAVLLNPDVENNPFAVLPILCVATFMVGLLSGRRLRVAIVVTLVTLNSMTLCQYRSATGIVRSRDGVLRLYLVRVATVALGCTLPVLVTQAVLPWFTSEWALATMAGTFRSSATITRYLYDSFFEEGRRAYTAAHGPDAAAALMARFGLDLAPVGLEGEAQPTEQSACPAPSLKALVVSPLVAVQSSLMRDAAVWTRGLLATPEIVAALLRCSLQLADRLGALALVVADTPPLVHGRLSGWAFEGIVLPMHADMQAMLGAMDRVVGVTVALLGGEEGHKAAVGVGAAAATNRHARGDAAAAAASSPVRGGHAEPTTAASPSAEAVTSDSAARRRQGSAAAYVGSGSSGSTPHAAQQQPEQPWDEEAPAVGDRGAAASSRAEAPPLSPREELQEAICELNRTRLRVRRRLRVMRHAFHSCVLALDEQHLSYATHPDDAVRVNAMLFALVKVLDRATATARAVLAQEPWRARHRSARFLWLRLVMRE